MWNLPKPFTKSIRNCNKCIINNHLNINYTSRNCIPVWHTCNEARNRPDKTNGTILVIKIKFIFHWIADYYRFCIFFFFLFSIGLNHTTFEWPSENHSADLPMLSAIRVWENLNVVHFSCIITWFTLNIEIDNKQRLPKKNFYDKNNQINNRKIHWRLT